jgi:hypothetical protein
MIPLSIILDGDGCWPDLAEKEVVEADLTAVAPLEHGTALGKPTVTFRVDLPDGKVVLAQTTLSLFLSAADAFKARLGDPRT